MPGSPWPCRPDIPRSTLRLAGGLIAAVTAVAAGAPAAAQEAAGDWVGTLDVAPGTKLPLVIHLTREGDTLAGTLDSPAQGARGLPLADVAAADGRLTFAVPAVGGTYAGTWDAAAGAWRGEWRQNGTALPLAFAAPPPPQPLPTSWDMPSDSEIAAVIAGRIAPRTGEGIVVGTLSPAGRRIVAEGPAGATAFGEDTVFEIGSISKVFTALILADMVARGDVALDDPAAKYLPDGATMPHGAGRAITLRDLATHRSGLPRLPDNMPFGDPQDPYADYSERMMLDFLAHYALPREPGAQFEYSNFGAGLLGYLLARAAGTDYPTLLRERVTGPLGLDDTTIALTADQQARLAPGYDGFMQPAAEWHLPALMGAGAIRSTARDMLAFAAAALDPQSAIAPAMAIALATRMPIDDPASEQALGWQVFHPAAGRDVLVHHGGTGGYRSTLALDLARGRAVVVLANAGAEPSTPDIGLHVLLGTPVADTPAVPPAPPPPQPRTAIALPAEALARFVGRYDFGGGVVFAITRDGGRLLAQRQGTQTGPVLEIAPEAPLRFFFKAVDAQVTFTAEPDGRVTGAQFTQGAATLNGMRMAP